MGFLTVKIEDNFSSVLRKKLEQAGPKASHILAVQIAKDTEPFVPAMTKSLTNRTQVADWSIIYPGPYARYLYEGKVMIYEDPPYLRTRSDGKVVKSHYGQKKKEIEKPLDIKQKVHDQATDHWLEASRDQNIDKWVDVAERAMAYELRK